MEYDDILYTVMLNSDIKSIGELCQTYNNANIICNSNHFWKDKFTLDYPSVSPNTFNYKKEYQLLHQASITATAFVNILTRIKSSRTNPVQFNRIRLSYNNDYVDPNEITWLPQDILDLDIKGQLLLNVDRPNKQSSFIFTITIIKYIDDTHEKYTYVLTKDKFINFFTLLFYYKPDFMVEDERQRPLLLTDNIEPTERNILLSEYWKYYTSK